MTEHITWHDLQITRKDRETLLNQKGKLLWFTGLSGSGKSTIANALSKKLMSQKNICYVLDGDNIRHGLNGDLGFSEQDRVENIRRIAEVSKLFVDCGIITLTAFISPFRRDRQKARDLLNNDFIEIYVRCSLETCEQRDPKGLYKKARKGEIKNFTGIHQEYEEPEHPEIILNADTDSVETCVDKILDYLKNEV